MSNLVALAISLLVSVESRNVPTAVGDDGRSIGVLQMQVCAVDEVNRLIDVQRLPHPKFTHQDRYSTQKSYEMATIFLTWAAKHYRITDPEKLAWRWNRPKDGHVTRRYKKKVHEAYKAYKAQWS